MSKAPVHYTQDTLEAETPTSLCGIRTTHTASTENAQAVTCQRCLKALNKPLPFAEVPSHGPQTNDATKEAAMTEEVEQVQDVPMPGYMTPEETQAVMAEPAVFAGATFKIVSEGVEMSESTELTDAAKEAQEMSASLGPEAVVTVELNGVVKMQYQGGRHIGPSKKPAGKVSKSESKEAPKKATKKIADAAPKKSVPKPNGKAAKVTTITDAKPKQTKAQKQVALGKAMQDQPKPETVAKSRVESTKSKVPPICMCGCKEPTKGGRFRPGHDARYYSAHPEERGNHGKAKAAKG